jgi:hypothetical protein
VNPAQAAAQDPQDLSDRIRAFANETYPGRLAWETKGSGRLGKAQSEQFHNLHRQLRHSGKRLDFDEAWDHGDKLGRVCRKRWVNPITMSWACARYGHVADVFFRATFGITYRKLIELVRHLQTVCHPVSPDPGTIQNITVPGIEDELVLRRGMSWENDMRKGERLDRRCWNINVQTYVRFIWAYREQQEAANRANGLDLSNPVVALCHSIAEANGIPYDYRERSASLLISDGLRALQAGREPGEPWKIPYRATDDGDFDDDDLDDDGVDDDDLE